MPRIPTRTEPYTSPARQQRHYKSKRDRTLKQLGAASHINGSQFALILVNAKGEVETFASELFKSRIPDWFDDSVKAEAKAILLEDLKHRVDHPHSGHQLVEVEMADEDGEVYQVSSDVLAFASRQLLSAITTPPRFVDAHQDMTKIENITPVPSPTKFSRPSPPQLSPVDVELANRLFNDPSFDSGGDSSSLSITPSTAIETPSSLGTDTTSITTTSALDEWFCNKFHVLQQNTCKLVAKCWIKIIEPKKQNKYPYQKGEDSRPDWWPEGIRHKEPDHLVKPERNALLLAILNCGRAPIARLELSTAEAMAHIQPDKFTILREIYDMAKEQELRRIDPSYRPRLPLATVVASTRPTSPADDNYNPPVTTGKRQRSPNENVSDAQRRRQARRITVDTTSVHDEDNGLTQRQLSNRRRRGIQSAGLPPFAPLPPPPHPFPYLVQHDGFPHHMSDASMLPPHPWTHQPPQAFTFATGMQMPFGYSQFHGERQQQEAHAELTRRLSAPILSGATTNPFAEQFGEALPPPPPSPNTIALMMWGAGFVQQQQQQQDLSCTEAMEHPVPSYPHQLAPHPSWSSDFQQLVETTGEMHEQVEGEAPPSPPLSPPREGIVVDDASWLV